MDFKTILKIVGVALMGVGAICNGSSQLIESRDLAIKNKEAKNDSETKES